MKMKNERLIRQMFKNRLKINIYIYRLSVYMSMKESNYERTSINAGGRHDYSGSFEKRTN